MPRILGETPNPFELDLVARTLENLRKQPLKDARAQEISEYWVTQAPGISGAQAREIGMLWITKILGVDEKSAIDFASGDVWSEEIGLRHAGSKAYIPDSKAFWEGVHESIPEMVRDNDLEYLITNDKHGDAAWTMISHIDYIKPEQGYLTTHLVSNALLYK